MVVALICAAPGRARAADEADPANVAKLRRLSGPPGGYYRVLGSFGFGEGLRFNNPYRLQTQLGYDAESVSATASYVDFGIAASFGRPDGIQKGVALHVSWALTGISQQVFTPSYQMLYRKGRVLGYGRFGTPLLLSPDPNVGFELAGGVGFFVTAGIAISGELVGDLFYGAGTREVRYAVYPILSGQLGVLIDYEVLP